MSKPLPAGLFQFLSGFSSDLSDIENSEEEDSDINIFNGEEAFQEDTTYLTDTESQNQEPSSDGVVMTSPVKGTREEQRQQRKNKAVKKQKATIQQRQQLSAQMAASQLEQDVQDVLDFLSERGVRFGEFLKVIFDPTKGQGNVRWHEFFARRGEATQILDWWTASSNSQGAREEVQAWAVEYVAKLVAKEAKAATDSKILQTKDRTIDQEFVTSFSFSSMYDKLKDLAPTALRLIKAFATSRHAEKKHMERRKERTKTIVVSVLLTCLGEYSHSNNILKRLVGLYLYSSGAQRQTISVLATLGSSESYTNIVTKNLRKVSSKKIPAGDSASDSSENTIANSNAVPKSVFTGTLRQLSESIRHRARSIAAHGCYSGVYDNINLMFKVAEQVIGRHDTQQNGTCATLVPLFDTKVENLKTIDYQNQFLSAPPLKLSDILHTPDERKKFRNNLIFTILRIIVNHGGEGFKKFESNLAKSQPESDEKIKLHKTELYPLPAWPINESTVLGNVDVDKAFRKELDLDNTPNSSEQLRFYAGDQLSCARFRAIENIRAGQETGFNSFFGATWIPGLFHAKIADAHGVLFTHWGKPNTGNRNPGSLWFHNTRLDRLPITLTSLPSFRTIRDITFVSLYARVLHCLLLVSNVPTLDAYLEKYQNWDTLVVHAGLIFQKYARTSVVDELRRKRARNQDQQNSKSTVVFENAVLFMRDALISREFTDAVKAGDSGRIILVLKVWALNFRGNGRTKYAYEMLHLLHNLSSIWGKELRAIILKNWLVNPTGKPNSWVELDLMQEHLNYWIKVFYKAHGSNASWEWLESIAPCVDVLRQLSRHFNDMLGADQGTKHPKAKLERDIGSLMDSLDEHDVYRNEYGPILDEDDLPSKDCTTSGFHSLTASPKNPRTDYNEVFLRLQSRRRMDPVSIQLQKLKVVPVGTDSDLPAPQTDTMQIPETSSMVTTPPLQHVDNPFTDNSMTLESEFEVSDPVLTEFEQILVDLQNGVAETTLSTMDGDNVALDMDTVYDYEDEVELDEDSDSSSSESDGVDE